MECTLTLIETPRKKPHVVLKSLRCRINDNGAYLLSYQFGMRAWQAAGSIYEIKH